MFVQLNKGFLDFVTSKKTRSAPLDMPRGHVPLSVAEQVYYNPQKDGLINLKPDLDPRLNNDEDLEDSEDLPFRFSRGTSTFAPRQHAASSTNFRIKHTPKSSYLSTQKPRAYFSVRVDQAALADAIEEISSFEAPKTAYNPTSTAGTKRKAPCHGMNNPLDTASSPPPTTKNKRPRYELAASINPTGTDPNTQHHTITNARRRPQKYSPGSSLARRAANTVKSTLKSLWGRSTKKIWDSRTEYLNVPNPWASLHFGGRDTCFVNGKPGMGGIL